jgi:hypothetical protein
MRRLLGDRVLQLASAQLRDDIDTIKHIRLQRFILFPSYSNTMQRLSLSSLPGRDGSRMLIAGTEQPLSLPVSRVHVWILLWPLCTPTCGHRLDCYIMTGCEEVCQRVPFRTGLVDHAMNGTDESVICCSLEKVTTKPYQQRSRMQQIYSHINCQCARDGRSGYPFAILVQNLECGSWSDLPHEGEPGIIIMRPWISISDDTTTSFDAGSPMPTSFETSCGG